MSLARGFIVLLPGLGAVASACDSAPLGADGKAQGGPTGTLVVGVTTDLGEDLSGLHLTMRAGGVTLRDEELRTTSVPPTLHFPVELRFEDLPDQTPVDVELEAVTSVGAYLSRRVSSRIVAGKTLLLRAPMETQCIPNYQLPGGRTTPTCAAPQTCIEAACGDPFVAPSQLEVYASDWAASFADACKPREPGPPEIAIGQGQETFALLGQGGTAIYEKGSQGGYHIWVAVRMKNLHQLGTVTTVTAYAPDLDKEFGPAQWIFGYDPVPGGFCELYGLRFVVALEPTELADLLGATLQIKVEALDVTGDVGVAETVVTLSDGS